MIALLTAGGVAAFVVAYFSYARYVARVFGVGVQQRTPAHALNDGHDYYPARAPVLMGHHFSSIAGAGPVVGPIIGALVFGWAPALVWIVLGSIFIGGVHDFGSLVVSVRHRARSIAEIARGYLGPLATRLFLVFVWLTLVYVIVVFLDLTAATFAPRAGGADVAARGGGVATASVLFIVLAIALGVAIYRLRLPLRWASLVFVPLVFVAVYVGQRLPLLPAWMPTVRGSATTCWALILLGYCFVASITPVWALLQPRDYLSSFLLYACLCGGLAGIVSSPFVGAGSATALALRYPAWLGFESAKLGYLFPALFITVACGACSGFHSVVASGTTAKQLDRERDARFVGYGSMLLEGVLALVSVAAVAVLSAGAPETRLAPPALFASGLGRFLAVLGLPAAVGEGFGLLALSTFLLTSLDTCTRLGRYVLEELLAPRLSGARGRLVSTALTLALPALFALASFTDASGRAIPVWRLIWPVFGSTNQLLGGLALMVITLWLRRSGRPYWITLLPMLLMITVTTLSLVQLTFKHGASLIGVISACLLALALALLVDAGRAFWGASRAGGDTPAA